MEYLSNRLFYHTQILTFSLDDQTVLHKFFKWRWPLMEEDQQISQISKVEYLSNNLLDPTQTSNFSLDDQKFPRKYF